MVKRITESDMLRKIERCYRTFYNWRATGKLPALGQHINLVGFPNIVDQHIAMICGYNSMNDMQTNYRRETDHLLHLLSGPNAWCVYQMLLARRGVKEEA